MGYTPPKHEDFFEAGTCNSIDDVSGAKYKRSHLQLRWDDFLVIPGANNPRQPQDFAPRIQPQTIIRDARPQIPVESSTPTIEII